MKVIPYPDHWMSYKSMPKMKGKRLGIFAHCFAKSGARDAVKRIYGNIVDIAIEEPTCVVLSGSQSLVSPNHNLLYEEWSDYDEFFEVQVARKYRKGFLRWLDPVREGPISPEFTEMFYSAGDHPLDLAADNAFALVQSVHIDPGREADVRQLLVQHVNDVSANNKNLHANVHQSINNPQHFLLYEIWNDFEFLVEHELKSHRRSELESLFYEIRDHALPDPATELFQIYYDPGKYQPATMPF